MIENTQNNKIEDITLPSSKRKKKKEKEKERKGRKTLFSIKKWSQGLLSPVRCWWLVARLSRNHGPEVSAHSSESAF